MKIRDILYRACTYFTVVTLAFYSLGMLVGDNGSFMVPKLSMLFAILFFCIAVSFAHNFLSIKRIPALLRYTIHFFVCATSYTVVFIFLSGVYRNGTSVIIGLALFIFLYAIIMGINAVIKNFFEKKKLNKSDYKNQFDKLKD